MVKTWSVLTISIIELSVLRVRSRTGNMEGSARKTRVERDSRKRSARELEARVFHFLLDQTEL